MKSLPLIVAALTPLFSGNLFCAEVSPPLAADAAALVSGQKTTWKSAVIGVGLKDGSRDQRILVIEFTPFSGERRDDPPHASAKLSLATPTGGVKGFATASSSLGDGSDRDVRLQEKDGARTITFARALETISKPGPKAQERLNKVWSSTFNYELKNDALVLKGFSKEGTTWGVTKVIAPEREITFKRVDP